MVTRRKIFGWLSGVAAGIGIGLPNAANADPLAPWRPTDEQLDIYRRLRQQRNLLVPGLRGLVAKDKHVLDRELDILSPGLYDDSLTFHSYNGHDRTDRYFHATLEMLETERATVWETMQVALLPPPKED